MILHQGVSWWDENKRRGIHVCRFLFNTMAKIQSTIFHSCCFIWSPQYPNSDLLLLLCQMETPVSLMKVAACCRSSRLPWSLLATGGDPARLPCWAALRRGRTATDVLLSDCQYCNGQCKVYSIGSSWGSCSLSWAWTLLLAPVWSTSSRGQPCTMGAHASAWSFFVPSLARGSAASWPGTW